MKEGGGKYEVRIGGHHCHFTGGSFHHPGLRVVRGKHYAFNPGAAADGGICRKIIFRFRCGRHADREACPGLQIMCENDTGRAPALTGHKK